MFIKKHAPLYFLPHLNNIYAHDINGQRSRSRSRSSNNPIPLNTNANPAVLKWNQISLSIQTGNNDRICVQFCVILVQLLWLVFVLHQLRVHPLSTSCSSFINIVFILYQLRVHPSSTSWSSFINFVFILHQHRVHPSSASCLSFTNFVFILHQPVSTIERNE